MTKGKKSSRLIYLFASLVYKPIFSGKMLCEVSRLRTHYYIPLQLFSDLCLLHIGMAMKSGDFAEQPLILIILSGFIEHFVERVYFIRIYDSVLNVLLSRSVNKSEMYFRSEITFKLLISIP